MINQNLIKDPKSFIESMPHYSWLQGEENVDYLEKRFEAMKGDFMFNTIEFTNDLEKMKTWFPLVANGRDSEELTAASKIDKRTELNFVASARQL